MGCPHCGSVDVRRSHTSYGLDLFGFHRCRCRACHGLFWLRGSQLEAMRARRRELEAPREPGAPPGDAAVPAPSPDEAADAPRPVADLSALDEDLSRRRSETPPH
jgi:hypothetical protein